MIGKFGKNGVDCRQVEQAWETQWNRIEYLMVEGKEETTYVSSIFTASKSNTIWVSAFRLWQDLGVTCMMYVIIMVEEKTFKEYAIIIKSKTQDCLLP